MFSEYMISDKRRIRPCDDVSDIKRYKGQHVLALKVTGTTVIQFSSFEDSIEMAKVALPHPLTLLSSQAMQTLLNGKKVSLINGMRVDG